MTTGEMANVRSTSASSTRLPGIRERTSASAATTPKIAFSGTAITAAVLRVFDFDALADYGEGTLLPMLARLRHEPMSTIDAPPWAAGDDDSVTLPPHSRFTVADIAGPGRIVHMWFTIGTSAQNYLRSTRLRMYWDGADTPAVDVPFGDFHALGHGVVNRLLASVGGLTFSVSYTTRAPRGAEQDGVEYRFVDRAAVEADAMDHHPDIDIRYTTVVMTLSTHSAGGLTTKDVELAAKIDELAG